MGFLDQGPLPIQFWSQESSAQGGNNMQKWKEWYELQYMSLVVDTKVSKQQQP